MLWILLSSFLLLGIQAAPVIQRFGDDQNSGGNPFQIMEPSSFNRLPEDMKKAIVLSFKPLADETATKNTLLSELKHMIGYSDEEPKESQTALLHVFSLLVDYSYWVKAETENLSENNQKASMAMWELLVNQNYFDLPLEEKLKKSIQIQSEANLTSEDKLEAAKFAIKGLGKVGQLKIAEASINYAVQLMKERNPRLGYSDVE